MEYNPKLTISKVPLFQLEVNYDSLKQFLVTTQENQKAQAISIKNLQTDSYTF